MNNIMEQVYTDRTLIQARLANPLPPLDVGLDVFSQYLHEEMRQCYNNGHDHAAMVMACALVESTLKDAVHFAEFLKNNCRFHRKKWDAIDRMEFAPLISLARKSGVITKDERKQQEWFRKHIRNVWMHGSTPPDVKDFLVPGVMKGKLSSGKVRVRAVKAGNDLTLQRMMRIVADRKYCAQMIPFVDGCVRTLITRSLQNLEAWKRDHPTHTTDKQVERVIRNMKRRGFTEGLLIARDPPEVASEAPDCRTDNR